MVGERTEGVGGEAGEVTMTGEILFGWFDDEVPLVDGEFPETLGVSTSRLEAMESAGIAEREDETVRLELANGRATYQIINEDDGELTLELAEGEVS